MMMLMGSDSRAGPLDLTNSGERGEGQKRNKTSQGFIRLNHIVAGQFPKHKINQSWHCDRWGLFSAGQTSQWDKFLVLSSASKESLETFGHRRNPQSDNRTSR